MKIDNKLITMVLIAAAITIYISIQSSLVSEIVFCDVGQGSATLLQIYSYQLLVDTGPDQRVLGCIGNHIPFFDRTIETVIISHNQKDHNGGLSALLKRYKINHVYGPPQNKTERKIANYIEVFNKTSLVIYGTQIDILKASQSSNINESANVVTITSVKDVVFLSSDINGFELKKLIPKSVSILEVPHHGSKYGLYPDSLDLAEPGLAVISVGKKNTYGHPSRDVLDILKAKNIKVWRTDVDGELVIPL